jgi:NAD(P)-dependent dehydrogenase (short-subunit alcohol dehydrogenase family)
MNFEGRGKRFGLPAGRLFVGDVTNSDLRQLQLTFDTNFWGPVRVLQAALPLMPNTGNNIIFALNVPTLKEGR